MIVICAWCDCLVSENHDGAEQVSHGMCARCERRENDKLRDCVSTVAKYTEPDDFETLLRSIRASNPRGVGERETIATMAVVECCADCGEPGERVGHMSCQYPQDH